MHIAYSRIQDTSLPVPEYGMIGRFKSDSFWNSEMAHLALIYRQSYVEKLYMHKK